MLPSCRCPDPAAAGPSRSTATHIPHALGKVRGVLAQGWKGAWCRDQIQKAMNHPIEIYQRLKRRAHRLLMKGDVERYMRTLRALHDLRTAPPTAMV